MPTIKENLEEAIRVVSDHGEDEIDLSEFEQETACGTLYCTYGLLVQEDFFQAQGLNMPRLSYVAWAAVDELFGPSAFQRLFDSYGDGSDDRLLLDPEDPMTHKELAIARLQLQLERHQ